MSGNESELSDSAKTEIDGLDLKTMLQLWRFAPAGHYMFQGASGDYFAKRMHGLREEDPEGYTRASKEVGWGS